MVVDVAIGMVMREGRVRARETRSSKYETRIKLEVRNSKSEFRINGEGRMTKRRSVRVAVQPIDGSETTVVEEGGGEGGSDQPADEGAHAREAAAENEQEDAGWGQRKPIGGPDDPQEARRAWERIVVAQRS